jgi:phosphatidylglycerol:prolipoprotein diacylglycerol transferase
LIVTGAAAGILLGVRRSTSYGIPRFDELAVGLLGFGAGVVGATLLYVGIHFRLFLENPSMIQQAGHVFYGGFVAGALAAWIYCRAYKVPLAQVADAGAPGLALAHSIGRLGCLVAGCCYGRTTASGFRHPVQAYESAGLLVLCVVLLALSQRLRPRPGALFAVYLGSYGVLRLAMEHFRGDDLERGMIVGISTSQIFAVLALGAAVGLVVRLRPSHGR